MVGQERWLLRRGGRKGSFDCINASGGHVGERVDLLGIQTEHFSSEVQIFFIFHPIGLSHSTAIAQKGKWDKFTLP